MSSSLMSVADLNLNSVEEMTQAIIKKILIWLDLNIFIEIFSR